jgi:hypothetical protein
MSGHHKYSPSSLELYEACTLFEKREWLDNSAADEGTMMHNVLETGDRRLLETSEQEAQVNKCFKIMEELVVRFGTMVVETKEKRLKVFGSSGELITQGTADLVLVSEDGKKGIMLDWKMGISPISPADRNFQLQTYVAGLFQEIETLEEVEGIMVAPRQGFDSRFAYYRKDVEGIIDRIETTIAKREDPFKQPSPDESACTLCNLRDRCPALLGTAVTVFKGVGLLPLPEEFAIERLATPLDRAKAQVLAKILTDWASEVKKYNTSAVYEHGEPEPPGFSLRKRSGGFAVDNKFLPEVLRHLSESYEIDPQDPDLLECFSLSASKLATYISDKTGEGKKDVLMMLNEALPEIIRERGDVVYLQKKSKKITDEQILHGAITE